MSVSGQRLIPAHHENLVFQAAACLRKGASLPDAVISQLPDAVTALRREGKPVPAEVAECVSSVLCREEKLAGEEGYVNSALPGILGHLQPLMDLAFLNRRLSACGQTPVELGRRTVLHIGRNDRTREVPVTFYRNEATGSIFALAGRIAADTEEALKALCDPDPFARRAYRKRASHEKEEREASKPVVRIWWTVPEVLAFLRAGEVFWLGDGNGKVMLNELDRDGLLELPGTSRPDPPDGITDRVRGQWDALDRTIRAETVYQALLQATPSHLRPRRLKQAQLRSGLEVPFAWDWGRRMAGLGGQVKDDRRMMQDLGLMRVVVAGEQGAEGKRATTEVCTIPGIRLVSVGRNWWPEGSSAPEIVRQLIEGGDR